MIMGIIRLIKTSEEVYWTCMVLDKVVTPKRLGRETAVELIPFAVASVTPVQDNVTDEIRFNLKFVNDLADEFPGYIYQLY